MDKKDTSSLVQTRELPLLSEEDFEHVNPYGDFVLESSLYGDGCDVNVSVFSGGTLVTVLSTNKNHTKILYQEFIRGTKNGSQKEEGR